MKKIGKWRVSQILRYSLLGFVLIFITIVGFLHQQEQVKYPPVDALCPFGGLESLFSILFQGHFLQRVFSSSLILLLITIVLLIFSGRSFCGWICPLGTLQGILHKIGALFFKKRKPLYLEKDKKIRWLRYVVLLVFTIGAWIGGRLLIRPYDPWVAWMHLSEPQHMLVEFPVAGIILLLIFLASLYLSRPFCRYLCPMGAILGLLNKLSPFRLKRVEASCTDCSRCSTTCPVGINTMVGKEASPGECISCGECVEKCDKKGALQFRLGKWQPKPLVLGILVLLFFFGTIFITQAFGVYRSSNYTAAELKGSEHLSPEQIKGYMTLSEVAWLFDISPEKLYEALDLQEQSVPGDTQCKEIAATIGRDFETDDVRLAVAALLNIPAEEITLSCAASESSSSAAGFIPGTMTLGEICREFNIPQEVLYKKLNLDSSRIPPGTQCRELKYLVHPNFHTTVVRQAVAEILEN